MKEAVIYTRVSTQGQEFISQIESLKIWSKASEYNVAEEAIFGEKVSGFDEEAERTEFNKMRDYVIKNNIKNIVVWELSRFGRSALRTQNEIEEFKKLGVNIHFKKENLQTISDSPTDKLLLAMLASIADLERSTTLERMARGRYSSVKNGKAVGYVILPYGYGKNEKGELVKNDDEAKVVQMIFDMALKGTSLYEIANHLNSLKIKTRYALEKKEITIKKKSVSEFDWSPQTLRAIITRTLYKGERTYKDLTIKVPAIVTKEDWDNVQKRFVDHVGYYARKHNQEFLFKAKMRCGVCDRLLATHQRTNRKDNYYHCSGTMKTKDKCDNVNYVSASVVDNYLFKALFQTIDSEKALDKKNKEENNTEEKKEQISYYRAEIEKLELRKKKALKQHIVNDDYSEQDYESDKLSFNNQIVDYENKINFLEKEIKHVDAVDVNDLLIDIYKSNSYKLKREFVTKYVNNIQVYKISSTNIKFENPLKENEKVLYFQLYAFDNNEPFHIVVTPISKNVNMYFVDMLTFDKETGTLTQN